MVKLRYIGDTFSILPVVENLKRKAPAWSVDVMLNRGTESLLSHNPWIRRVWVYDYAFAKKTSLKSIVYQIKLIHGLRSRRFDAVIDFTHGDRAALICFLTGAPLRISHCHASTLSRVLMNRFVDSDPSSRHIVDHQLEALRLLGLRGFKRDFTLHTPGGVRARVSGLLARAGIPDQGPLVAIHPGARGRLRQWRPERFAELARRLREAYGCGVLLVGGPGEDELLDRVEQGMGFAPALRSTSLGLIELAELFRRSSLFVGNDSAPGHLAAAVGCPTISLFGPTFPHMWRPVGPWVETVSGYVPCRGCRQEYCERPGGWCMDLIEVDEVWDRAVRLLGVSGLNSSAAHL